jgi:hypothetical protein
MLLILLLNLSSFLHQNHISLNIVIIELPALANIDLHGALGVDGETLVGVDGNTEETGIGVDELILVPDD